MPQISVPPAIPPAIGEAASSSYNGRFTTNYSYDLNGNFQMLKRNGLQDGGTYGLIDNLTFTLSGNQVTRIEDAVSDPTYNAAFNFMDGASQQNEYTYDKNGNLTKDLNKKISSIQYNSLNLPTSITYSNGKSAAYIYDAAGWKLRTSYKTSASATAIPTDYCGNMIYENNVLKQILVDGGYITFNGSTAQYHYYLQDHLGNNRVVCSTSGTVEQINHYYPFGGLFGESTNGDTQRYKYNGKELDRMHGLDWYDYGARHMTADAGRFTTMDPLAEKDYATSPYAYCGNNPIRYLDPNGKDKRDRVVGYLIGGITNIIPGINWVRDVYSPTDPVDYNDALRTSDEIAMSVGQGMVVGGAAAVAVGGAATDGGTGITIATGGAAAEVGVPVAVAGEVLIGVGATASLGGMMMMSNAKNNQNGGYDKGKNASGTNVNSKTLWKSKGKDNGRIDVENPKNRKGQIHYQDKKHKYLYDQKEKTFKNAPSSINKLLEKIDVQKAIKKGEKYLGNNEYNK